MKRIIFAICLTIFSYFLLGAASQVGCTPDLHVDGNQLKDPAGNIVVLHGVMDTPSMWFNNDRWTSWDLGGYVPEAAPRAIEYFNKIFDAITDRSQGAYCNVFRLHMEPSWLRRDGVQSTGESDMATTYDRDKVKLYLEKLFIPIAENAKAHGLYIIMRPPGVCPEDIQVGDAYQNYLMDVWDIVSQNEKIKEYSGWLSIELANEPVRVKDANGNRPTDGTWGPANGPAKTDFFQPIIDKIRKNGFKGVIWVPGEGYQSSYESYEKYPISDSNYGFAVHVYPGWYGNEDSNANAQTFISNFKSQVPGVTSKPVAVTEIDWSPGNIVYNADGTPKLKYDGNYETDGNYGTWGTASTSKWGSAFKAMKDYYGNISMTLTGTDDYVDMKEFLKSGKVQAAFLDKQFPEEGCGVACFKWYKEYAQKNAPICDENYVSVSIKCSSNDVSSDDKNVLFEVDAKGGNDISKVEVYDNGKLIESLTQSPYQLSISNLSKGSHTIKAVATDVKGNEDESSLEMKVRGPQEAYNGILSQIPGKIEAENFDEGGEGYAYHDEEEENKEMGARTDEGVDVKSNSERTCIGWTVKGEWLEYTVEVKETMQYKYTVYAATDNNDAAFHFEIDGEEITDTKIVGSTGDWDSYKGVSGVTKEITAGTHVLRLVIDESFFDVDWFSFQPWYDLKKINLFQKGKLVYASDELLDSIVFKDPASYGYKDKQILFSTHELLDSITFQLEDETIGEGGLITDDFVYDKNLSYRDMDAYLGTCYGAQGTIVKETYNGINGNNTLYVYLPVGYDKNKKYNIFYLMHGGGENETTIFGSDVMMQNILDNLIKAGKIEPMIVVTPTFNKCEAATFWKEFRQSVVPFVEGKYSTYANSTSLDDLKASRMHRAYGGFSMGGLSAWNVFANCLDIVGYHMPLSGNYWYGDTGEDAARELNNVVERSGLADNQFAIFCATGSEDIAYNNINPQMDAMKKLSHFHYTSDFNEGNLYYLVAPGKTHWWGYVKHYVAQGLPYFFHKDFIVK